MKIRLSKGGRNVLLGVLGGILGVLLNVYNPGTDTFWEARDTPGIVLMLFVGGVPGWIAGLIPAFVRAFQGGVLGLGSTLWHSCALGSVLAIAIAWIARRWMFFGERPSTMMAVFVAAVGEMVNLTVATFGGYDDLQRAFAAVIWSWTYQVVIVELLVFAASFFFRRRQTWRENLTVIAVIAFVYAFACMFFFVMGHAAEEVAAGQVSSYSVDFYQRDLSTFLMEVVLSVFIFVIAIFVCRSMRQRRIIDGLNARERESRRRELELAASIQRSALPVNFPEDGRYRIAALMHPAQQVGGDLYDFYVLPTGGVFFIVADVSGKGIAAAMFMMRVKATVRGVVTNTFDLAAAAHEINESLRSANEARMFATAWMGVYTPDDGRITYVNAGHNPPLIRRADGTVEWLRSPPSLVMGIRKNVSYGAAEAFLNPGDSILLYTDGITEALDARGSFFGEERLFRTVSGCTGNTLLSGVRDAVGAFAGGIEQTDDITLMVLVAKAAQSERFPTTVDGLSAAADRLEDRLEGLGCGKPTLDYFLVAFDEIASNVVRYSGAREFHVAVWRAHGVFSVEVSDTGVAFDPLSRPLAAMPTDVVSLRHGGMGVSLTRKLMQRVDYRRTFGWNIITLSRSV